MISIRTKRERHEFFLRTSAPRIATKMEQEQREQEEGKKREE